MTVDYRMGPQYQFASALEDAEDVVCAVLDVSRQTRAGQVLHSTIARQRIPRSHSRRKATDKRVMDHIKLDPRFLSLSGFSSGGDVALNLVLNTSENGHRYPSPIPEDC